LQIFSNVFHETHIKIIKPRNAGAISHILTGPAEANCPTPSSIRYMGRQMMNRTKMYGIRNAPPPF
jgi:hypothetical protein